MSNAQLYWGDCLKIMDGLIADGVKVDAIITDPPYGTTACKWDCVIPFEEMWKRLKALRYDNTPIVLFGSEPFSSSLRMSNIKEYKYDWVWKKTRVSNFLCLKFMPRKDVENVSVFYKSKPTYNPQMLSGKPYVDKGRIKISNNQQKIGCKTYTGIINTGERFPSLVIEFNNGNNNNLHPTQKPIALMEYLVKTYTNEGDTVLDFTMGSGTTGVACKNLNRNFIGIELDLNYYMIARERINADNA